MKTYEVEIMGTTYRTYFIDAESADEAVDRAMDEVDADWEIPKVWKLNAELSFVEEQEKMKVTELEVKESFDGELYFRLPDDLLKRLGWEVGDELKFIPQDEAFIIKKVKYKTIEIDIDEEELLNYMQFAHEKNITFNELCEEAIKEKLKENE